MTENKFSDKDKDKRNESEFDKDGDKDKNHQQHSSAQKEQQPKTEQHDSSSRFRRLSQFLDLLNIPRHHSGSSSSSNNSQQHSPQTPHAVCSEMTPAERRNSVSSCNNNATGHDVEHEHQQQQHTQPGSSKRSSCVSFRSEILLFDLVNGDITDLNESSQSHRDDFGTQRVYKKTSPNCVLTMYLPSREIILTGNSSSLLRGIVFADPKSIQGYRIYAQLTLTFRYGREDEEVMGIRFCNEAIMSLQQIWPKKEDSNKALINPLQEALLKRLGDGALAFTLALTAQAPPSVQLVPAKRYSGAPIGTSYDVRCFVADKTDEKFHRRASVKMGVRVIYQTDVFNHCHIGPENVAALINNPVTLPPITLAGHNNQTTKTTSPPLATETTESTPFPACTTDPQQTTVNKECSQKNSNEVRQTSNRPRKSERGDSFPKLRLSPKTFRFSSRFGRSKSEVDKCSSEAFYNYSKSFQEYESVCPINCSAGPQGSVDKPFLLQDGRVSLRASLNKAWYTHGEDVRVTVNIRNDSRKTVRKIRVSAIQHVDVCMFNNGKFKNVVADSDNMTPSPCEQQVAPGAILNTIIVLRPQRGVTKNWIALEDTLQRSFESDDVNAYIAASAVRTPHFLMQAAYQSPNNSSSLAVNMTSTQAPNANTTANSTNTTNPTNPTNDERNVFAIYVSYYVKVKLTLTSMGGELSLKLPFMLVHIDEEQRLLHERLKLRLQEVPIKKKNGNNLKELCTKEFMISNNLDRIESVDEANLSRQVSPLHLKDTHNKVALALKENNGEGSVDSSPRGNERRRNFKRSETLAKDLELDVVENHENAIQNEQQIKAQVHTNNFEQISSSLENEDDEFLQQKKKVLENNSKNVSEEEIKEMSA